MTSQFFGDAWCGRFSRLIDTPIGALCMHCDEPIAPGDSGVVVPHIDASRQTSLMVRHRECFLRDALGSVGHQLGRCTCFGGTEEDPPGLTRREAARAAVVAAGL